MKVAPARARPFFLPKSQAKLDWAHSVFFHFTALNKPRIDWGRDMDLSFEPLALPALGGTAEVEEVPLGPPTPMTRREKAAIVVRYLLNEGAEIALEDLPEDLQAVLTQQMGAMRLVNKATVKAAIDEFTEELESIGLAFNGGIAGALQALDGKISPHTHSRLRKENGVRVSGNPWKRILSMPAEKLKPIFELESPEVSAVVISKLDVSIAAELLGMLPGPLARSITYSINQTTVVTPEAVDRIGMAIAAQLDAEPPAVFDDGPVKRIGAILNNSSNATREDVLEGLDETDKDFADAIRQAIFTFANIPERVSPRDVPTLLRGLDQDVLKVALKAASATGMDAVPEFIFSNMSGRLADAMREEIDELPEASASDGEDAMATIATAIREMDENGEIFLQKDTPAPE